MYISDISVVTNFLDDNEGSLEFELLVIVPSMYGNESVKVQYMLFDQKRNIVANASGTGLYNGTLIVPNVNPWWPVGMSDTPAYLYILKVSFRFVT